MVAITTISREAPGVQTCLGLCSQMGRWEAAAVPSLQLRKLRLGYTKSKPPVAQLMVVKLGSNCCPLTSVLLRSLHRPGLQVVFSSPGVGADPGTEHMHTSMPLGRTACMSPSLSGRQHSTGSPDPTRREGPGEYSQAWHNLLSFPS